MSQYQTLYHGRISNDLEVRKYPPTKRTITVAGRQYFLQFPPIIVARIGGANSCKFFAAICDDADHIYMLPFGGCAADFSVCLDQRNHYNFPPNVSLDSLLRVFWQTDFRSFMENGAFGGRLHNWAKMDLEQVFQEIKKLRPPINYLFSASDDPNLVSENDLVNYFCDYSQRTSI